MPCRLGIAPQRQAALVENAMLSYDVVNSKRAYIVTAQIATQSRAVLDTIIEAW
jgi:hypothetical protein